MSFQTRVILRFEMYVEEKWFSMTNPSSGTSIAEM